MKKVKIPEIKVPRSIMAKIEQECGTSRNNIHEALRFYLNSPKAIEIRECAMRYGGYITYREELVNGA